MVRIQGRIEEEEVGVVWKAVGLVSDGAEARV